MIGLEELYLANLIVRKNLAPAEEVRATLEALDKGAARGDLYGKLAARGGHLAQPDLREKAMVAVQRYMFTKNEAAFAARIRARGAVPPAVLDQVIADQKQEGLAWKLADRLVKTGKLSMVRCSLLQKEAAADLKKQEQELVTKHRSSRFQETVSPASVSGKRTQEYYPSLSESGEGLAGFGTNPAPVPVPAEAASGEMTIKLPAGVAAGLQPLDGHDEDDPNAHTVKLPAVPPLTGSTRGKIAPALAPGPLAIGSMVAQKFEVVAELGRGGMGVVYRARNQEKGTSRGDRTAPEEVALKAVATAKGGAASEVMQRFKREILTATLVTSTNVCEVYDAGQGEGLVYMAMELIEGKTLREVISKEAPLPVERALALFEGIVQGVAACHSVNVIHRDLKPDNVRINTAGVPKIVDFGIARLISKDSVIQEQVFVTIKGTLSGTPAYVAPELVMEPDLVDARCDLYSLGVIFYELLTGKLPYTAKATVRETLRDAIEGRPIPLEEAAPDNPVPEPVQRILFKLLEKDQLVRFQSAEEVLAAIKEATGPPAKKKRTTGTRRGLEEPAEKPRGITARIVQAITSIFRKKS